MKYFIGVDGGGTGCRVVVANRPGEVLATAKGGPANIATNLAFATNSILLAVSEAFAAANLDEANIKNSVAVLGLAGSNLGSYADDLSASLPFLQHRIVNDSATTYEGAIGHHKGCVAAIGTGSVFSSRTETGLKMLGGWGFLLGDDGSGASLGRDILHRAILAHDGVIPPSELTTELMSEFENDPANMVGAVKTMTPGGYGKFAPRVVNAAKAGDVNAVEIMEHHTELVERSINAVGFDPDRPFAMLGGLGRTYLERLPQKFRAAATAPKGNALDGALAMALRYFG